MAPMDSLQLLAASPPGAPSSSTPSRTRTTIAPACRNPVVKVKVNGITLIPANITLRASLPIWNSETPLFTLDPDPVCPPTSPNPLPCPVEAFLSQTPQTPLNPPLTPLIPLDNPQTSPLSPIDWVQCDHCDEWTPLPAYLRPPEGSWTCNDADWDAEKPLCHDEYTSDHEYP